MKKFWILAGISALLFLSSCAMSVGIVFDDSVPIEKSTYICTYFIGEVTAYNGIPVKWKQAIKMVQIPAGDALLDLKLNSMSGNIRYLGNASFKYNFQPQKQYYLRFSELHEANKYGVSVYVYTLEEKFLGTASDYEAHFEAIVPVLEYK
ncbi:MAG: hypothetical protein LBV17_06660 [Treponema sp.]|jgi:hypothetical protein|nr:hypothetical protein [Treponema sp.]